MAAPFGRLTRLHGRSLHNRAMNALISGSTALLALSGLSLAMPRDSLAQSITNGAAAAAAAVPAVGARSKASRAAARPAKSGWSELPMAQREALAPLADHWNALSDAQKRKWLVVSKNYHDMPPPEQVKLHGRMNEWIGLSPQQRRTARFNFAETKRMSVDEKQKKWEAYQALSPDDRRRFSESAAPGSQGAAAAVKPVPRQKLATVAVEPDHASRPRLAKPNQIDPRTLLPRYDAAPAKPAPARHPQQGSR